MQIKQEEREREARLAGWKQGDCAKKKRREKDDGGERGCARLSHTKIVYGSQRKYVKRLLSPCLPWPGWGLTTFWCLIKSNEPLVENPNANHQPFTLWRGEQRGKKIGRWLCVCKMDVVFIELPRHRVEPHFGCDGGNVCVPIIRGTIFHCHKNAATISCSHFFTGEREAIELCSIVLSGNIGLQYCFVLLELCVSSLGSNGRWQPWRRKKSISNFVPQAEIECKLSSSPHPLPGKCSSCSFQTLFGFYSGSS